MIDIRIMVICYDSDITEHDKRTTELSNAALHMNKVANNREKDSPLNNKLRQDLPLHTTKGGQT